MLSSHSKEQSSSQCPDCPALIISSKFIWSGNDGAWSMASLYALLTKPQHKIELYHTAVTPHLCCGALSLAWLQQSLPYIQVLSVFILTCNFSCSTSLLIVSWLVVHTSLPELLQCHFFQCLCVACTQHLFTFHISQFTICFANVYRNLI